jgi:hypothetical protein
MLTHNQMLEPIKSWLEGQGFKATVAQEKFPKSSNGIR